MKPIPNIQGETSLDTASGLSQGMADLANDKKAIQCNIRTITERMQTDTFREMDRAILQILNSPDELHESIRRVLALVKAQTNADAVGLRLEDGEDFPYFSEDGFSKDFLLTENSLAERGSDGGVCRDEKGKVCLECTCGLVISGKTNPANPFFTPAGSFWTNDSFPLLDLPPEQDPRHHPRNECIHQGYASVALIPVRDKDRIVGLLHLNARRKNGFTLDIVKIMEDIAARIGEALTRKRIEATLRETQAVLQAAMDQSPAGIAIADAPSGKLRYVNDAGLLIRGGTRESVVNGIDIDQYVASWLLMDLDGRPLNPEEVPLSRAVLFGETCSREFIIRKATGEERIVLGNAAPIKDEGGNVVAGIVVFSDVTERKQAEAMLRQTTERLQTITDTAQDPILMMDCEGKVIFWNPAAERILGYTKDEAIGQDLHDLIAPARFHPAYRVAFASFLQTGHGPVVGKTVELEARRKDGQELAVQLSISAVRMKDRWHAVGIIRDITERKHAERELQKMEKLESIGVLAGGIAHDFNNILQGLYGNVSLAKEDLEKTHPSYALLEEVEKSMPRAVRLTKQLLTFSKGGNPIKEAVSLLDMIEDIARMDLARSNVSLVYQRSEDLWPVDADKDQIQHVISNLIINARQAMPKGGKLTITLENVELPADAVSTLQQGRYVKVVVKDEGTGIDPAVLDRIFDPYFTTKQASKGLGLSAVWSIIAKHNGHIGVVSELGKGTTFMFYLPAVDLPQAVEDKPLTEACTVLSSPAKILVMDDEDLISRLVVRMLTPCGHIVTTAPNGQEALALYRRALKAGAPFDVVIMDLTIPGGPGGKEVMQDLLKLDPYARAIVSSGYSADPVMANPAAYGFKGTVAKPYNARTLREAIERLLT